MASSTVAPTPAIAAVRGVKYWQRGRKFEGRAVGLNQRLVRDQSPPFGSEGREACC